MKKNTSPTITMLEQALQYLNQGYSIIPCGLDKRPLIASWKPFQTEYPTEQQIEQWFSKPNTNIGVATGELSNLTVIDLDNQKGQNQANADHLLSIFPPTLTIRTPSGGYHLYYTNAPNFTISAGGYPQYPHLDIRGQGGFVIAPPSTNSNGEPYIILHDRPIAPFPTDLFPRSKPKRTLTEQTTAAKGQRNDTIASFIGTLLQATPEDQWYTECLPASERANKSYNPPLPADEVRAVFESIAKKEKQRRENLIVSPMQIKDTDNQDMGSIQVKIKRNKSGTAHNNMANVLAVLQAHPYYKDTIKYNTFRHEIEYNGHPLEDADIIKIQYFMQTDADLNNISKEAVYNAIAHYAQMNAYDEAQDWLINQIWDGTPRLATWLTSATGVANDTYHRGIGSQWFMGIVNRIMRPGSIFDYTLVITGGQGLGKTSLFRIIGGPWYKSYTGGIDNKDFYLAIRGAVIFDLDEGATLYKSEAIKIKSIITQTHDEFRAPYDRVMKKFPRRFVFSMSTNDSEPFRDVTGNRRYWVLDIEDGVNFKWLEENRDQLYAEAYHYYKEKAQVAEVPMDIALAIQEAHLPDDSWTELVAHEITKDFHYCIGDPDYSTTIIEVFKAIFPNESHIRLDRRIEMRIASIFKRELGLEKVRKMVDGEQRNRWFIMPKKLKELQAHPLARTTDLFEDINNDEPIQKPF